jgi:hypothetical protein
VIMGLAVTRLLSGVGRLIRHREDLCGYWVHSLWSFNVLIYLLGVWWGMFAWNQSPSWNYFVFLFIVLYSIMLYLVADVLYPDEWEAALNLRDHFFEHRRWFFGLLLGAILLDIPETYWKEALGLRPVPSEYALLLAAWLVVAPVGLLSSNEKVHGVLPVVFLVAALIYMGWGVLVLSG